MDSSNMGIAVSAVAAAIGTPLLMKLWGKLSPPGQLPGCDQYSPEELRRRNNWIDLVGVVLSLSGICFPLFLYAKGVSKRNPWPVGLGFGLMVILPTAFFALVTLPKGRGRFREFWRFYELKYGIGLKGLTVVCVPLACVGLVSAYELVF